MKLSNPIKFKETEIGLIPETWNLLNFDEAVDFNPKRLIKKGQSTKFIEMANVQPFDKNILAHSQRNFSGGTKFKNGDTIMARITPCLENGKTAYINFLDQDEVAAGSTEFIVLSGKEDVTISEFVYYLAISPSIRDAAITAMTGTSGRQRVENGKLASYQLAVPSIALQKQIAEILSSLDDKIELNRKINANLEKIASALFKKWFVDIGDELPEGWRAVKLGELFELTTGKKDANFGTIHGEYPFFTCSQDVLSAPNYSFDSSSVLLSGNGDFNVKWYEGKFEAYQRTYVLTPYKKEMLGFLFYTIKYFLDDITAGHRGSVIRFITKGMINDFKVSIPGDRQLEELCKIFYEINKTIDFYKKEIENLSQIRDVLLPRLMSGKIIPNL